MPEFLLEVGCEEIPAGWLAGTTTELGERFKQLAAAEHLEPANVETHSTPRRLVLRADVLARQPDRDEEVWGPALKAARDAAGKWTQAALGFAKKCGVDVERLKTGTKPGGKGDEQLLFLKSVPGRPAAEVLKGVLAATLRGLSFPKRMSWDAWLDDGKGAFPFGRPIRWLVSVLDGQVVPFSVSELVDGAKGRVVVEASDTTRGHRFFPRDRPGQVFRAVPPERVGDLALALFEEALRLGNVILRREQRIAAIREGLASVARDVVSDHGLVETWADMVELPAVVIGRVPTEFQGLPREVLETVLVHHQKYIPLLADGRTVSRFAAVTDTDGKSAAAIARGMERVVVARLRDAAFFFEEDLKRPLRDRVAELAGVMFHAKLGSYKEKAERVSRLVEGLAASGLTTPQQEAAREAAQLAKVDLTTQMVREFTELQGVMGGIYLRAQGAPASVAAAVAWHYHPLSLEEDAVPAGRLEGDALAAFAAVSLADKLDTLAGYFGLGLQPTGSSDPYGLRRAAQGAVRVLVDFWPGRPQPSLAVLAASAIEGYGATIADPGAAKAALLGFLLERIRHLLTARGFAADEVEAALGAREPDALDDVQETRARLLALRKVRSEAREDFEHLATAFKRAANILEQANEPALAEVRPQLFEGDAERSLYEAVASASGQDGGYESRLRALATLRDPVDRFFDPQRGVFVMTDKAELRRNRLALLDRMRKLFYRIADISKLGGSR